MDHVGVNDFVRHNVLPQVGIAFFVLFARFIYVVIVLCSLQMNDFPGDHSQLWMDNARVHCGAELAMCVFNDRKILRSLVPYK